MTYVMMDFPLPFHIAKEMRDCLDAQITEVENYRKERKSQMDKKRRSKKRK